MAVPSVRIRSRIIIPFTVLLAVFLVVFWLAAGRIMHRFVDDFLTERLTQVAIVLSGSRYAMTPEMLQRLKAVAGAEIAIATPTGDVIHTTMKVTPKKMPGPPVCRDRLTAVFDVVVADTSFRVVRQRLQLVPDGELLLSLWQPRDRIDRLAAEAGGQLAILAVLGIGLMVVVGGLIARGITAPLENLVAATRRMAAGDSDIDVPVRHHDEVGELTAAFNHMGHELRAVQQQVVEAEKLAAVGQLAASMAHEIRNPLTGIKLYAQMIEEQVAVTPEVVRMAGVMVDEVRRLEDIIDHLMFRVKTGTLCCRPADVNRVVGAVVELAAASFRKRGIRLETRLAPDLPLAFVDADKIKQVLWNLLANARDVLAGCSRVCIHTSMAAPSWVEIVVEDDGPGMGAYQAEQLQEPFFSTKPEGLGLGLAITRRLIEAHGGTLVLENLSAGGMRAAFRLPVSREQDRPAPGGDHPFCRCD